MHIPMRQKLEEGIKEQAALLHMKLTIAYNSYKSWNMHRESSLFQLYILKESFWLQMKMKNYTMLGRTVSPAPPR